MPDARLSPSLARCGARGPGAIATQSRADLARKTARPRRFVFESFVCLADPREFNKARHEFFGGGGGGAAAAGSGADNGARLNGLRGARNRAIKVKRSRKCLEKQASRGPAARASCMRKNEDVQGMAGGGGARRRFMQSKRGVWGTPKMQRARKVDSGQYVPA